MSRPDGDSMVPFDMRSCTGCRTCEMACSYHHAGVFQPSVSSMEITGSPRDGFKIVLYDAPEGNRIPCDGCRRLEEPLCVTFCPPIAKSELRGFVDRSKGLRSG